MAKNLLSSPIWAQKNFFVNFIFISHDSCKLSLYANSKKTDEPKTWEKGKKICNLGHNILQLYNVLVEIQLTTSKTKRDI